MKSFTLFLYESLHDFSSTQVNLPNDVTTVSLVFFSTIQAKAYAKKWKD